MTSTSTRTRSDNETEERHPGGAVPPDSPPPDAETSVSIQHGELDDARATDPVERLLEDSWETRKQRASRREVLVEAVAAALFLSIATPLAAPDLAGHGINFVLAGMLVALYALVAGSVRFPIGAGYVVPTYVMLVPMLLLLPPATVPLFVAAGLVLASLFRLAARRVSIDHVLFSIPNAWHALGTGGCSHPRSASTTTLRSWRPSTSSHSSPVASLTS